MLKAWAEGDEAAGRAFYDAWADRVARFFAGKTRDDVSDLVQRTFLRALETARKQAVDDAPALLFTIARRELIDHYRRNAKAAARFDPEVESVAGSGCGPSTWASQQERRRLLLEALRAIPLDAQIALELYYWEDLPMDAVARVLGVTRSAAINRVHRAREKLGELLRQREPRLDPAAAFADLGMNADPVDLGAIE